ncbi:BA75_04913T0 [Komagataella pastoris]|uniref:BA75_04913T0 n=1 Tax=Komagataella pastoris TaxID=4922 RepID=A0A1B2JIT1_PICPA|nr:BA75_04913T0 [Komagataella pastoris]
MCEDGTIKNVILELSDPPKAYQKDNKIRVYNQSEEKKIMHEYVNYLNKEDGPYVEEFGHDRLMYIYMINSGEAHIIPKHSNLEGWTPDPSGYPVQWCEEMIKEVYNRTNFDEELYEKFKPE